MTQALTPLVATWLLLLALSLVVGAQLLVHTPLLVCHAYTLGRSTRPVAPLLTLGVTLVVTLVVVALVRVVPLVAAVARLVAWRNEM